MAFPCAFLLNLHQMDKHMISFDTGFSRDFMVDLA
jgi:hypothetical protein